MFHRVSQVYVMGFLVGFQWLLQIHLSSKVEAQTPALQFEMQADRVRISADTQPIADYVFVDSEILRPYLTQISTLSGYHVTRAHPPVAGVDALDHATMHPGIWYGFGDINGVDFWRNKGSIKHLNFTSQPKIVGNLLQFATRSQLIDPSEKLLCHLNSHVAVVMLPQDSWLLIWKIALVADEQEISLGDQEEMGFGVRVASALTEKNGGLITNSDGFSSAKNTWGHVAEWCDYSRTIDDTRKGIAILASPENFRSSWWHNRDYGLMVANPFGRAALKRGDTSTVVISRGKSLELTFGAIIYGSSDVSVEDAYQRFAEEAQSLHTLK